MANISDLVKAKSQELSFKWTPVLRRDDQVVSRSADVGKLAVEELMFFPSKTWVLSKILAAKVRTNPGFLMWLYLALVYAVALLPVLVIQGAVWQCFRGLKAFRLVMMGRVTYRNKKAQTKNK